MRKIFLIVFLSLIIVTAGLGLISAWFLTAYLIIFPLFLVGIMDMLQTDQTIRRNYPLIGNLRYLFEIIRPEIVQYFIERDTDGKPFTRVQRSLVYQRAKGVRDTIPFGTQIDVYESGYEWLDYSLTPARIVPANMRVTIGGEACSKKYSASLLNISAMSYGALSRQAVEALNAGAKTGNFAHNTGEGSISPYHLKHGGDLIWQIGTGYFGCRDEKGNFNATMFQEKASLENVKMIEIKISQGAKPGHGGILPGNKVTPEIADIRHVTVGKTVLSPPAHSAFDTPSGLLQFVSTLRKLSGGKPVGFKLSIGRRHEFIAICKAMLSTGITPDFIAIDGGEGGTGAAPVELSNYVGAPLSDGLLFAHNCLVGFNLRDKVKIIASGKIVSAFGMIKHLVLGADLLYAARSMLLSIGCIQALRCNSNECPAGITTQNPNLTIGLDPKKKSVRVYNFHRETLDKFCELLGAMGCTSPRQLQPDLIHRRVNQVEVKHYGELYNYLAPGSLLSSEREELPPDFANDFLRASKDSFLAKTGSCD